MNDASLDAEIKRDSALLEEGPGPRPRTMLCILLDESGSMAGQESDVIGGVNGFLADQRRTDADELMVTIVKFDTEYRPLVVRAPIEDVKDMDETSYQPRGSTALLDAVMKTVQETASEPADRYVFLVYTDGQENSSREATREQVRKLIAAKEAEGNWTFVFMAANPEAFADGQASGFAQMVSYAGHDNRAAQAASSGALRTLRSSGSKRAESYAAEVQADLDNQAPGNGASQES
jgi:Mg-chelatase subunit ChlD